MGLNENLISNIYWKTKKQEHCKDTKKKKKKKKRKFYITDDKICTRGPLKDLERPAIGNPRAILYGGYRVCASKRNNGDYVYLSAVKAVRVVKPVKRRNDSEEMAAKLVSDRWAGNRRQIRRGKRFTG